MGAGAVTSNVKSDHSPVALHHGNKKIETDMKKLGALIGDFVEIGCNSVLNPGTVIGRRSRVYPLTSVRGTVPPDSIVKSANKIVPLKKS
jgi:acetyltransferase-like isoleucine patch superfamily enzyme